MHNDGNPVIHYTIDKTPSVITDIGIPLEAEKDQSRLMELLHLKEQLMESIQKMNKEQRTIKLALCEYYFNPVAGNDFRRQAIRITQW